MSCFGHGFILAQLTVLLVFISYEWALQGCFTDFTLESGVVAL
jgi:hypothetical protein